MIFVGYLDSTALRYFQIDVFGVHFKIIDTIFTAAGLLTIVGGLYALIKLRKSEGKRDLNEEIDALDGSWHFLPEYLTCFEGVSRREGGHGSSRAHHNCQVNALCTWRP